MLTTILKFLTSKDTWAFIKTKWKDILIIILFLIVCFETCGHKNIKTGKIIKSDSITTTIISYKKVHDTTYLPAQPIIKRIPVQVIPANYIPSTNYDSLKKQYNNLADSFLAKNVYDRKFPVDSIGTVELIDTTTQNKLTGVKIIADLHYPITTIHTTITNTIAQPVFRKLFIGGGIIDNTTNIISGISGGFLYQTKQDRIFEASIIFNGSSTPFYQFSTYWKIHFK